MCQRGSGRNWQKSGRRPWSSCVKVRTLKKSKNFNYSKPFSNQKITYCGLDQKILRQTMAQDVSRSFGTVGGELRDETRKDVEN
ncbi:hypothetical protein L3Y34_012538 [Caenorhabditis briggsae]|uniref:Uncharacterized protein n=1 Tax=Caenorhabditis briggsae TaxID=6238 RepID=A0AAE8ZUM5_CAEBR|nr:hypothetical protein L3Y34_012538 [Caenorhabditis briggsae]